MRQVSGPGIEGCTCVIGMVGVNTDDEEGDMPCVAESVDGKEEAAVERMGDESTIIDVEEVVADGHDEIRE